MNKSNQTSDKDFDNGKQARCIDGSTARLHQAAKIEGHKDGTQEVPQRNGTR